MKTRPYSYTFSVSGKTVTLTNYTTVNLESILAIINTTTGYTLYQTGSSSLKATVSGNVITLNSSIVTTGMADTDKLLILVQEQDTIDNDVLPTLVRPEILGGKAVTSSTYNPGYTDGDAVVASFDKSNGAQLVNQGLLSASQGDSIKSYEAATSDPTITGGSWIRITNANSTAQTVKSSGGNIYNLNLVNLDATPSIIYVKFYNKTGATSSDTPFLTIPVASGVGQMVNIRNIIPFDTACSVRCVTGSADNNTTAPATSPIIEIRYA
jgi:hypothetical protein